MRMTTWSGRGGAARTAALAGSTVARPPANSVNPAAMAAIRFVRIRTSLQSPIHRQRTIPREQRGARPVGRAPRVRRTNDYLVGALRVVVALAVVVLRAVVEAAARVVFAAFFAGALVAAVLVAVLRAAVVLAGAAL